MIDLLEKHGLLLLADNARPALAQTIAGGPIRGSWWGHPKGHAIFDASCALQEHPDVLVAKVVDGKVTFVHRRLWPAFLGLATSRAAWQMDGLGPDAIGLLARADVEDVRGDDKILRLLAQRWLLDVFEVHAENSGRHVKVGRSWARWASDRSPGPALPPDVAHAELQRAVAGLGGGRLPC